MQSTYKISEAIIKTYIIVWFDAKIKSRSGIMSLLRDKCGLRRIYADF
ncbi:MULTISPECIES: hypothetical protein [Prevotellaceae]|nr:MULTISPECIES: hypothetical protein [Prevotellaceae]